MAHTVLAYGTEELNTERPSRDGCSFTRLPLAAVVDNKQYTPLAR
jgi:hypothetical protein